MLVCHHKHQPVSFMLSLLHLLPGDSEVSASFLFFFFFFRDVSSFVVPLDGSSVGFFCIVLGFLSVLHAGAVSSHSSTPFEFTVKNTFQERIN